MDACLVSDFKTDLKVMCFGELWSMQRKQQTSKKLKENKQSMLNITLM